MRFLLATRNPGKLHEIRAILSASARIRIASLDELGIPPDPEEDAIEAYRTFRENALAKARYFANRAGIPAIADDSGLRVDALDGAPGVRSKRFAADAGRTPGPGSPSSMDELNNALLLERLEGVPPDRRGAHFVCAAAAVVPDGPGRTAIGSCSGRIAPAPRGPHGFGYDPLFLDTDLGLTFGELDDARKNARSHRARAFRALAGSLATLPKA